MVIIIIHSFLPLYLSIFCWIYVLNFMPVVYNPHAVVKGILNADKTNYARIIKCSLEL